MIGEYVPQLLPCPFCGSAALMLKDLREIQDTPYCSAKIECDGCDITMESEWFNRPWNYDDNKAASIETTAKHALAQRWNRRVGGSS